jgi:hypothetical protein
VVATFFCFMIAAISRKKGSYAKVTNDNKTITHTITFGIKHGPCEARSFLPFPLPFLSLFFPFSCPFSLFFPCPFLFLFFSFCFPFLFLSFSFPFPFPFPFLFLSLSYWFLSLPFLFLVLFPFLTHVNSLIKVRSQHLEN